MPQATAGVLRELGAVPVLLRALRRGAWGDGSEVPHTLLQLIVNLVTLCATLSPESEQRRCTACATMCPVHGGALRWRRMPPLLGDDRGHHVSSKGLLRQIASGVRGGQRRSLGKPLLCCPAHRDG